MTNMLVRSQQIHQARLVEHFSVFGAWRLSSLRARGPGSLRFHYFPKISGQNRGLGMVYEAVQAQAAMLAFNDIYRLFAIVTVVMISSFLIMRGQIGGRGTASAH
jgi:hypothetical protein